MRPSATFSNDRRPTLHSAAACLLYAVALSGSLGLAAHAETGAMTTAPEMSCAEFSAMDAAGQMQAMATMTAGEMNATDATSGAMTTDGMATDAMATGAMVDHAEMMAMIEACTGHDDMMAVDAMHAAVGN